MANSSPVRETIFERFSSTKPRIDREKGIVYGVRVVAEVSKNKRRYPASVRAAAHSVYEGCPVNIGHHRKTDVDRPVTDRFGRLRNLRDEGDATYADLHYKTKHYFAETFLDACENAPDEYALSHHADVTWDAAPDREGNRVARIIHGVNSVDIVLEGGTNNGIFESDETNGASTMALDVKSIAGELKDAAGVTQFLKDLFAALTLDAPAKMQVLEGVMSGMSETAPDNADLIPAAAMESLSRRGAVGKWAADKLNRYFVAESLEKKKTAARELCKVEGLEADLVTDTFLRSLVLESDQSAQKEMIADRRRFAGQGGSGAGTKTPPKSSTPGSGSRSVKDLVAEADFG